jgi:hypothetical protein
VSHAYRNDTGTPVFILRYHNRSDAMGDENDDFIIMYHEDEVLPLGENTLIMSATQERCCIANCHVASQQQPSFMDLLPRYERHRRRIEMEERLFQYNDENCSPSSSSSSSSSSRLLSSPTNVKSRFTDLEQLLDENFDIDSSPTLPRVANRMIVSRDVSQHITRTPLALLKFNHDDNINDSKRIDGNHDSCHLHSSTTILPMDSNDNAMYDSTDNALQLNQEVAPPLSNTRKDKLRSSIKFKPKSDILPLREEFHERLRQLSRYHSNKTSFSTNQCKTCNSRICSCSRALPSTKAPQMAAQPMKAKKSIVGSR